MTSGAANATSKFSNQRNSLERQWSKPAITEDLRLAERRWRRYRFRQALTAARIPMSTETSGRPPNGWPALHGVLPTRRRE
jgi:hypothetical protein